MRKLLLGVASAVLLAGASISAAEAQFYVWGGQRYCWYDFGWHGPGGYWCGYPWRNGCGWGVGWGWHGWHQRVSGSYPGGFHHALHGGGYRGGFHGCGGHHGGFHGGGSFHGGHGR